MLQDKIIEEADQALQHQEQIPKQRGSINIINDIKATNREVETFLSRLNSKNQHVITNSIDKRANTSSKISKQLKSKPYINSNRYNYYGKYRFEQKQKEMHIDQPSFSINNTEPIIRKKSIQSSRTIQKNKNKNQSLLVNDSLFIDADDEVLFPSKNYYIHFNKAPKKNLVNNHVSNFDTLPQKKKPIWVLQKKIVALQKEVKQLRKSKVMNHSWRKTDQPIRIKNSVQMMLQTLWP